ncbi:MAG: pyrroline-5-carboxylate reductase [Candidatus Bathyarchaeia archaeon]
MAGMKIGVIGAGRMGEALISGFLRSGAVKPAEIIIYDTSMERLAYITQKYNLECCSDCETIAEVSDIVIISVKPKDAKTVLECLGSKITPNKTVVSVVAGLTTKYISQHFPLGVPVIRAMPNIACAVGDGMIAISPSRGTSQESLKVVQSYLNLVGRPLILEEKYLSAVTGLSGSGPAYVALVAEALADAGVKLGLSREDAELLASQTILGTGRMLLEFSEPPSSLIGRVVTPGGTTAEGLRELEKGQFKEVLSAAVIAAAKKAEELETR